MDPKTIEMNNLHLLNSFLDQAIQALSRQPRLGQVPQPGFGFSPLPTTGTDTVFGPWSGSPMFQPTPFTGQFGAMDPFFAQRSFSPMGYSPFTPASYSPFTPASYSPFGQASFGPGWQPWNWTSEVSRQAQLNQALAARQSVLEAMCRACGIPV